MNVVRSLHRDPAARPFLVIWEVTRACALACNHCRAEAVPTRHPCELSTEEGFALLDDLAAYGPPRPIVVLTGGDPFERPDLAELVAHGTAVGLHMSLSPSVTPRLTPAVLAELRAAGAGGLSLSLDGSTAATHDGIRGVPGVFAATMRAADEAVAAGYRLQVNTTVRRSNVAELPEVLRIVRDVDAGLWSVFFLVPTGRGQSLEALDPGEVEEVLHWLHDIGELVHVKSTEAPQFRRMAIQRGWAGESGVGVDAVFPPGPLRAALRARTAELFPPAAHDDLRRRRPPLAVNAGSGFAFVSHLGVVQPSGFLPLGAGSVRTSTFREVYATSPLLQALRDTDHLGGRCGRCEFRQVCGGSRSRAFALTGDPLAEDPTCPYQPTGQPVLAVAGH